MTTEIVLCRQDVELDEKALELFRNVLYKAVDGLGQVNKKRWRRLWNALMKSEPGDLLTIFTNRPRSGPFHRRHFAFEALLFDSQERFEDADQLRTWLKMGAGLVDWFPGPKGGIVPVPRSMSYSALDDDGMIELHVAMVRFLRTAPAQKALWRHLKPKAREEMAEAILNEFEE